MFGKLTFFSNFSHWDRYSHKFCAFLIICLQISDTFCMKIIILIQQFYSSCASLARMSVSRARDLMVVALRALCCALKEHILITILALRARLFNSIFYVYKKNYYSYQKMFNIKVVQLFKNYTFYLSHFFTPHNVWRENGIFYF